MKQPTASRRSKMATYADPPVRLLVYAAIGLGVLLVISFTVSFPLRSWLRHQAGRSLDAKLRGDIARVQRWVDQRQSEVLSLASDRSAAALDLLKAHRNGDDSVNWQAADTPIPADGRYLGWAIVNPDQVVVRSSFVDLQQRRLSISDVAWKRLALREPFVAWPFRVTIQSSVSNHSEDEHSGNEHSGNRRWEKHVSMPSTMMAVVLPLMDGGRPLGGWVLLMDPVVEMSECLEDAEIGQSGESIAFNDVGQLISASRFEASLRKHGELAAGQSSVLNVSLRNDDGELTTVADQATRGGTGSDFVGVEDYRGVPVMASWRWMPEYQIGLVAKIDVAEVMYGWRWFWRGWMTFLVLMIVAMVVGFLRVGRTDAGRSDNEASRRLGQYDLQEMVGRGGMGAVYRGRHQLLRRDVAIKVLEADELSPQAAIRFEREVQMTGRLRHPNTVDIYDYGRTEDGTFFYVMEFVDGITLQELVDRFGPQPAGRVIHLMLQICGSLGEAHQQGMIHRDIKPSNILVTARAGLYDMIKVLDFGLVKIVDDTRELTHTNGITGTPMYMSPESVRDAAMADQRSDLYSVAAVGYTLLTGQPTFDEESSVDVCLKQLKEMPIRPDVRLGSPLPEDLQNVLMSCLRKDPEERPRSIEDLQAALRHCQSDEWSLADALNWWEVEYVAYGKKSSSAPNSEIDQTGKSDPNTTAKS